MEKEIKSLFRGGNQDEVLSEAFRLTITRKDIQTLNNLNWLNDEVKTPKIPVFHPFWAAWSGKMDGFGAGSGFVGWDSHPRAKNPWGNL